ncbi:hypothetical protein AO073_07540 [Pseudomonas syringae ICMP 11293]|uniref:GIY-YIG nuclease family protein n=1 Tax=Pseudomonas syringae TaxID=317 RepID=UPI0007305674|nr:GIY-YIG nuclease family protein [Pseudomonas syringae]KTB94315.1 hypothetical protein AO073_07540 [Pseudomonas syringae ICMP 11293]
MDWKLEKCARYLYVLGLSQGKFYVGQAKDPDKRIRKHFSGSGSQWTRLHPPLKELMRKSLEDVDYRAGELAENEIVLDLMRKYGYENVRGGFFSNTSVEHVEKALISHGYGSVISTTSPSGCQVGGNDPVFDGICTLTENSPYSSTDPASAVPAPRQVKRGTEYFLFVLKLESDCYYVGYSSKPDLRIRRYFAGKGSDWTDLHKPVEVLAKRSLGTLCESEAAAKTADATISMMRLFGWRNVRGAAWKSVDAETTLKQLRAFGYYEVTR